MLKLNNYFNLSEDLEIVVLWGREDFVWDPITNISNYLSRVELGKIEIPIPDGVFLENPDKVSIGEGCIIEPGVYIKGPALIGKHCKILQGAYIRENVILRDHSVLGHCCEVKNSLFLKRAHAAHFNYVGDSILGQDVNLGAGAICANVRLDRKNVRVFVADAKVDSNLKKLGGIIGDGSQIGCNCVINPGTLIGKSVFCPPGIHLSGTIASFARIKAKQMYSIEV